MSRPRQVSRLTAAVDRRIRTQRAIDTATVMAVAGLGTLALAIAATKAGALDSADCLIAVGVAAALPLLGALIGGLRPVDKLLAAQLIDRTHGLASRCASAIEFHDLPADQRTAFILAAIADAEAQAPAIAPRRAMPLRMPRDLPTVVGLGMGVLLLWWLEVPVELPTARYDALAPLLMHPDDIDAFAENLDRLVQDPETSEQVRTAAEGFNRLMEDLVDRRLDRTEALRRVRDLEQGLQRARGADAEALEEALRELSHDLDRAELTREAAEALRDGNAERAERAMRTLAESLRDRAPSQRELEQLRQALRRAAERQQQDNSEEIRQREEEEQRLLGRQREQGLEEQERRLLRRRQRELERLRRENAERQAVQRQLERLQRELSQAAEDLNRHQSQDAAEALERGAEDLNRMAREQMSEEQMRQMAEQLRQLRELLRRQQQAQGGQQGQQGQQGQGQGQQGQGRMDRFVLRARGQGGTPLQVPGGQQGQGQGGQQGQQGQQGQGQGGQQGQQGQGQGGSKTLRLGQGGNAQLEIPGMGQGGQQGQGQGGNATVGPGAGTGHDPTLLDDPTRLGATRQNTRVEGEQGEGESRSEVILGAADRGFASRGYRRVYTDYRDHAEEVLEQDEVPDGYRFYIRRYFQLIRPREEP